MGQKSRNKRERKYPDSHRPYAKTPDGIVTLPIASAQIQELIRKANNKPDEFTQDDRRQIIAWLTSLTPEQRKVIIGNAEGSERARDLSDRINSTMERVSSNFHQETIGGISGPGLRLFTERYQNDELGVCKHIRNLPDEMTFWLGWKPDKVRCVECMAIEVARIKGTQDDRRCDECKGVFPSIANNLTFIPSVNIRGLIIPVQLMFGLCLKCRDKLKRDNPAID
jgi:hypothetical protein